MIRAGCDCAWIHSYTDLEGMPPEMLEQLVKPVPLRRVGDPEEMFKAIQFMIECDYFTGRCIEVDGGLRLP